MNPCCGVSNQTGTQIIATMQLVLSILLLIIRILGFIGKDGMTPEDQHHTVASIMFTFLGLVDISFAVLLLVGANKRNRTMCMVWFVAAVIGFLLAMIGTIWTMSTFGGVVDLSGDVVGILLKAFFLLVVWEFMKELRDASDNNQV